MAPRFASRKRQTRLNFTPTPFTSSPPHRSEAYVRVDVNSTPSKRRRVDLDTLPPEADESSPNLRPHAKVDSPSSAERACALPTPAPSSQLQEQFLASRGDQDFEEEEDDDIVPRSVERGPKSKARIAVNLSDDASDMPNPAVRRAISLSSESDSSLATPQQLTPATSPKTPANEGKKSRSSRANAKSIILGGMQGTAAIADRTNHKTPPKSARTRLRVRRLSSSSASNMQVEEPSMTTRSGARRNRRSSSRTRVHTRPVHKQTTVSGIESSEQLLNDSHTEQNESESEQEESDDQDVVGQSARRRTRMRQAERRPILLSDKSSDSGDVQSSATAEGLQSKDIQQTKLQDGLKSELDDELADLRSSDVETRERRTRGKPQTSERNKRLDKLQELKRRRKGVAEASDDCDDDDDNSSESDQDPPTDYGDMDNMDENMDEYEADFIQEDDEGTIGVDLTTSGVPLELTSFARQKPFEYFKYEVEWMIHNKLDPAFDRHDEVYQLSHKKLDDEFVGHAGSTYKSAAWTQNFIDALMSRPDFSVIKVPTMEEDKCEACNRSKHPPKFVVTLSGKAYDKQSLEPLSKGESSDEEDEDESDQEHEQEDQTFHVGRFCYGNAEIAHTLYHWRYHLNDMILLWLAEEGHLHAAKIVKREKWHRQKKQKLADKIVDGMVEGGQMKELYRSFKDSLEAARTAKPGRFNRDE